MLLFRHVPIDGYSRALFSFCVFSPCRPRLLARSAPDVRRRPTVNHLAEVAELAEAESLFALIAHAPEPARSCLGIASARIGGGVVLSMRHDSTGYWSK